MNLKTVKQLVNEAMILVKTIEADEAKKILEDENKNFVEAHCTKC